MKPDAETIDDAVVSFITAMFVERGWPPTIREIGERFGWSSPATTHWHLRKLVRQGRLDAPQVANQGFLPRRDSYRIVINPTTESKGRSI